MEWLDEESFQQAIAGPEGREALADLPNFAAAGVTIVTGHTIQLR